jgi:hypothetical protein
MNFQLNQFRQRRISAYQLENGPAVRLYSRPPAYGTDLEGVDGGYGSRGYGSSTVDSRDCLMYNYYDVLS